MEDSSTSDNEDYGTEAGRRIAWSTAVVSVVVSVIVSIVVSIVVLAAAATVFAQSYQMRSVRDGVFSSAQVDRGKQTFEWICMECHEIEEYIAADAYLDQMDGETVWQVFEYIWAEMPEDQPGWLDPEEYADVLSYLLSVYGMPAGDEDMPIDRASLEAIVIERPARGR